MGTAATERSAERPGDGASPGACTVDQITPEQPEERPPSAGVRARLAARCWLTRWWLTRWWLSRTGKTKSRGPNGRGLLRIPLFLVLPGRPYQEQQEEGGRTRGPLEGN
jgi:hypothetical protein